MVSDLFFRILNFKSIRHFANRLSHQIDDLIQIKIQLKGIRLCANSIDRFLAIIFWKYSVLEGFESKYILNIIKPGWTVLDIGANIGYYTVQFAKKVKSNGKVIAVEPFDNNLHLLNKNIKLNQIHNVEIIPKAISSKSGIAKLYISEGHAGDHRIYNTINGRKTVPIETITIDDLVHKRDRVDLIKMDIQGAEHFALDGMKQTLSKNPKINIVTEFSPSMLRESGGNPEKFIDFFIEKGFLIKYFNEKRNLLLKTTKEELINNICKNNNYVSLYIEQAT
jgi:FkbM family methyltransferase